MQLMDFPRGSRRGLHINSLVSETTTRATGTIKSSLLLFSSLFSGSLEMEIAMVIMEVMTSLPQGHTTI